MYAFLNRGTVFAFVVAAGTLIVLFALLPGQANGRAIDVYLSSTLAAPAGQGVATPVGESDSPVYPGTARVDNAPTEKDKCKDCAEPSAAVVSPAAELKQGGPDIFGYTYIDSNEKNGPLYSFVDIRGTGTEVYLYDDDFAGPLDIGFEFTFYDETKTEFYIGSNGNIGFSADSLWEPRGVCPIIEPSSPNDLIALQWSDLIASYDSHIDYQTFDTCPYGGGESCLVVQYTDMYHFYSGSLAGRFQAILFENSDILIQFADTGTGVGEFFATGIENATGTDGLTYACAQPDSLSDELAILFTLPNLQAWKTVSDFLPEPGQPITFTIELENRADNPVSAIVVDDFLPPDLFFRGPVTISPDHPEAVVAEVEADLPRLVENLDLAIGEALTITLPTTLATNIIGARLNQVSISTPDLPNGLNVEAGLHVVPDCGMVANNVIQNCSFESGDLTGWTATEIISPLLPIQVAGAGVGTPYGQFTSEPIRGEYAVVHGFDGSGPGEISLAQDVTLPEEATSVEFVYRVGYDLAQYYAYGRRTFAVVVEPEGGGPYPLQTSVVYVADAGRSLSDSGDLLGAVDISAFAGTTVRLIFQWDVPEFYSGPAMFQLDNVAVNTATPPSFANAPLTSAQADVEYLHTVLTSDADAGESRILTAPILPSWLEFADNEDGSATLRGTPKKVDVGEHPVVVRATDARGKTSEQAFSIAVAETAGRVIFYVPTVLNGTSD